MPTEPTTPTPTPTATVTATATDQSSTEFQTFFEGWLVRQEHLSEELMSTVRTYRQAKVEYLRDLISRVLLHYQQYYEEKSRMASQNIFLVFSPTWFTPFERSLLWIAGFKPCLAFRIVNSTSTDLTADQRRRLEILERETKEEEVDLSSKLATIMAIVAAPGFINSARRGGEVKALLETSKQEMVAVLSNADMLRTSTVEKIVGILTPVQNLMFFAASARLQLKARMCGLLTEAERVNQGTPAS